MADIDERLDRLTERHEALAQSLELLAGMVSNHSAQLAEHLEIIKNLSASITALLRVSESHERRVSGLET